MSCCDTPGLMPVKSAIDKLLGCAEPIGQSQKINLADALGYVLAEDQFSAINVPAFNNSAMDGYAVNLDCMNEASLLPISQRIIAGDAADTPLQDETCARIFTGAPVPANCNAVVMQEQCELVEKHGETFVQFPHDIKLGQNIRPLGQDIESGARVLTAGKKLRAQELGLLASVGIKEVPVIRPLKVAVLSTGNEIIEPGNPIAPGQIYNSNHYTLIGLLKDQGFDIHDCGTVIDDPDLIKNALIDAANNSDCIVTSGGVSVGEEDYVKSMVEELGQLDLWKIAIKPGKPFAFGRVAETPFLGLPGNPSAVFATFNIIAKPYLSTLQGVRDHESISYKAKADFEVLKPAMREQYLFVKAVLRDGDIWLEKYPNQSSGVLSSSSWSNGFARIPVDSKVKLGDEIVFIPF